MKQALDHNQKFIEEVEEVRRILEREEPSLQLRSSVRLLLGNPEKPMPVRRPRP